MLLFDENDAIGADYYEASEGTTTGDDALTLAADDRMPLVDFPEGATAFNGDDAGLIEFRHTPGGTWTMEVRSATGPVDASDADSLVFYLNGRSVARPALPRFALVDADGDATAPRAVDLGSRFGYNAFPSGFVEGDADVQFGVRYLSALPEEQTRPGYPEDLLVTFSDEVQGRSRPAIGVPAVDARFTVTTRADGVPLSFTFRDTDGDGTLSADGESIQIYTPTEVGSPTEVPTWELRVSGTPARVPGEGDVYLLAVLNAGVDADVATWQRVGVALRDLGPFGDVFDPTRVAAIRFSNGDAPTGTEALWLDYVAFTGEAQPPLDLAAPQAVPQPGDSSVVLRWEPVPGAAGAHVYRRTEDTPFVRLTDRPARQPHYADLTASNGTAYTYVLRSTDAFGRTGPDGTPVSATPSSQFEDAFLDLLQETAFAFFWEEANASNGLVRDRTGNPGLASIAAVGFGLSAYTVGIDRGYVTRAEGLARTLNTLEFFAACPQSDATGNVACGYRGFFYHFLDMTTGLRAGTSELSTIDTALLLGGVLHAREYFDGDTEDEARVRELADAIYEAVEWDWATPRAPLVALGWQPESGFIGFDWRGYNEAMILYLLAIGSPTHPLPAASWEAWTETYTTETFYGLTFIPFPPLFGHQYSHIWVDFRGLYDQYLAGYVSETNDFLDYFENSRRATLANRAYAIDNPLSFEGYGPNEWGFTASDDPFGYRARGAPPAQNDNGTITPTAPGGSIAFTPVASISALRTMYRNHRARLWGPYGFRDAYNLEEDWFATDVLGIDQGPILLMTENLRTDAVWGVTMRNEAIQRALGDVLGIIILNDEGGAGAPALSLDAAYPNPVARAATVTFTTAKPGDARLAVYDLLGRHIATLSDGHRAAGPHSELFDARGLASGVYVLRLSADGEHRTQLVTIVSSRP